MWRSRWAAIGAAVAVTFGPGGLAAVNAAGGVDSTTVLTDPVRVLDSRDPVNVGLAGPFASQAPQKLQITGSISTTTGTKTVVPTGATGVLLNVTAVAPQAAGFITIRPGDATGLPSTSSLNFEAGSVVPNAVLVALPTAGGNAGEIDITFDAYGQTGPTTDILIDVVGYTNNSTLAGLQAEIDAVEAANASQQAEIDAVEATNATQQTQIDAKANAADVYTKSEIDTSVANTLKSGGTILNGALSTDFAQIGAIPTVTTLGTGRYRLTFAGLAEGCTGGGGSNAVKQLNASVTGLSALAIATTYLSVCPSGNLSVDVTTLDPLSGTAVNGSFSFLVFSDLQIPLAPALYDGPEITCTVQAGSEPICE